MCFILKAIRKADRSLASSQATQSGQVVQAVGLNVNEEYAKAFRTQSYAEFWSKVQNATADKEGHEEQAEQSSSSPFHCYGVLAEHILEPDEESVKAILQRGLTPELNILVADYFHNSAEASKLCGTLLKNIEQAKINYRSIKNVLDCTPSTGDFTNEQWNFSMEELQLFMKGGNPFADPTAHNFQDIHDCYDSMLKRLQIQRKKIHRKLKLLNGCKKAAIVWGIAASAAVVVCAVVIVSHALIAIVACPVVLSFPSCSFSSFHCPFRTRLLARHRAQLEAAVKGTYILNRDFDTISRLVTRLHDEVEHDKGIIKFLLHRKDDRHPLQEVIRQLRRNDSNFNQQLDELEKHVYLCFMTINRARMLLVHEIQAPRTT
ncbi:UPF0496 protein At3g49070 [Cryptomeria japonica]|uniref:UPF0496 protein At3g49070 n=1 Tax=Cryptomeria japonica TaxID=3369 RepID=UPI0025ABEACF|nr:UPF0496 protein At3g49070 [Cryptomeria japonica]